MGQRGVILKQLIKKYLRETSGQFALHFSILGILVFVGVSASIDMATLEKTKSALQDAGDVAALAIAKKRSENAPIADYDTFARDLILESSQTAKKMTDLNVSVRLTKDETSQVIVELNGTPPGSIFFLKRHGVAVRSIAHEPTDYLDIYYILDRSASMLLADGPSQMSKLKAATQPFLQMSVVKNRAPDGCAFACHMPSGWEPVKNSSFQRKSAYRVARDNNVTLRWDTLQTAAMKNAQSIISVNNKARVGVVNFADKVQYDLQPTRDMSAVRKAITKSPNAKAMGITHYNALFGFIGKQLAVSGKGTAGAPHKFFVIVTDGVHSSWDGKSLTKTHKPLDPALCNAIRDSGAELAVIELISAKLPGTQVYDVQIKPFYKDISPALKACASPGRHYTADYGHAISAAFERMSKDMKDANPYITH